MNSTESRTNNSIKNLSFALLGQVVNILLQFIVRTIFIHTLGKEYLGINGLFSNILQFLALAELGIGEAITFSLYEPIAKNDTEKISILMNLFRKSYCTIGFIVLILGSAITPFLEYFIKDMPDIPHIKIIYLLNVLISSISYFYSYKTTFVIANQKNYIVTNNRYIVGIISAFAKCALLFLWKNYMAYLILYIFFVIIENVSISLIADKMYPVLKTKCDKKLDNETKTTIIDNISALVFHRIGGIIVFSSDNIMLSKLIGIVTVGLYSNYSLLTSTVNSVLAQFTNAVVASVGNLKNTADISKQTEIYKLIYFINFWLYSFATVAFAVLIQDFITLWAGNDYKMSMLAVIFILINFYITGMRKTNIMFNSTYGLVRYYKYAPIFEIAINIIMSVIFAKLVGEAGIFIGTTISTFCICVWVEPWILSRKGNIKITIRGYLKKYFFYALITFISVIATYYLANILNLKRIVGFVIKLIIVLIVPNTLLFVIFRKNAECKKMLEILSKLVKNLSLNL